MTYLIIGSIVAIAASAGFLIFGWLGANEILIYLSIAASITAAVCLALAFSRSRSANQALSAAPRGDEGAV